MYVYNSIHKIVICQACRSSILPGPERQERHLRVEPHRLPGDTLRTTVQLLSSYDLTLVIVINVVYGLFLYVENKDWSVPQKRRL
ncbi:hypothetical protein BJ878DRAFT_530879 [Calycina marina]|uniref:Uncharacterized protein n=1 Tax=Calycina marina TaxID=1763456 RepID=A0A9P7YVE7_9HELO|nr:hypothetical protein BJ878DRAFT_530879 [Calycina marina]